MHELIDKLKGKFNCLTRVALDSNLEFSYAYIANRQGTTTVSLLFPDSNSVISMLKNNNVTVSLELENLIKLGNHKWMVDIDSLFTSEFIFYGQKLELPLNLSVYPEEHSVRSSSELYAKFLLTCITFDVQENRAKFYEHHVTTLSQGVNTIYTFTYNNSGVFVSKDIQIEATTDQFVDDLGILPIFSSDNSYKITVNVRKQSDQSFLHISKIENSSNNGLSNNVGLSIPPDLTDTLQPAKII